MEHFCALSASTQPMQSTIQSLTSEIIATAQRHDPILTCTTLIPVLRWGPPTYVRAQALLGSLTCVLVRCFNSKGNQDVIVDLLDRKPFPRQKDESGPVVLLDTVIATGDTRGKLCDELFEMDGCTERSVVIVSCYARPADLDRLAMYPVVKYIVVVRKAEKCGDDGYLVLYTNGDIGDKI